MTNQALVDQLKQQEVLVTPRIIKAFQAIDRTDFVPSRLSGQAYANHPLPIGHGQTISQPYTVAFMLELLQPQLGQNILDIGAGSGWQTALLAHVVGAEGHVTAIERIPELASQCKANIAPYNFIEQGIVDIRSQNAIDGAPDAAPFDRIITAADIDTIPQAWLDQLKIYGRLITPQHSSLTVIDRKTDKDWQTRTIPGFVFVPFIDD
jgi:protein-L-isoaspartate(D-aspartate) O-methyltransferase